MVSAPNSLSMNAVNFQKAKSAPLVIKKNISTTPVQINKKTIDEGTMRKMLDEADQSWVDKGEIIQWLLDRGYDIEEPKTFMQKAGQIGKNIVWWTLWWLPALWPNLLGWAMKGLWSLWVAPWLPVQTKITQWMQDVWQELISRGEQSRNITEKALWANPNDTSTQLARSVVPIASQIIASWPLGLTKAGAWAFQTAKAWITARSLPTVAKGVAQWALVGWTEQAMFDVAQTGETTAKNVALWATVWGALPVAVPLVQQGAKATVKWVQNVVWWVTKVKNKVAEWLTASYLKNPAMREKYISKVWQSPEVTLLDAGIKWSLPDQVKQISKLSSDSRKQARQSAQNIQETIASPEWSWITKKMIEWVDTTIPWIEKKMQPILEMSKRFDEWTATAEDLIDAKTFLSRYESIYDDFGRVKKTGDIYEKEALADMYTVMKNKLEDLGTKYGIDFKEINRNTMKFEWLRDIATRAASRESSRDMLSLTDYIMWWYWITADPVTGMWALITKKALQSPYIWSNIANFLYTKWKNVVSPISSANVPNMNILSTVGQKWIKALPAPKATVVAPWGLPQVKQPIAPITKPIQILETWKANIKQPSTTKPQTLPTKTEAPLTDIFEWKLKKLESDTTLEKVPRVYLQRWKDRVIETKYGTITEMIPNNRWTIAKIKVGDNVYEASWLDFFEKKTDRIPQPPKEKIPLDNESSLTKMIRKGKKQALKISDGLSELWTTLDDMDAQQIKDFWELLRARNFDDARNKKRETLKAQVSKTAPKLPVATKTPLKQATRK